jgi:hypothetical protein
MAYGHAGQALAATRLLDADTAAPPAGLPQADAGQSEWPYRAAAAAGYEARRGGAEPGHAPRRRRPSLRGAADSTTGQGRCHV